MSMTLAAAAQASVKVKEAGFGVTPFNQCGYDGPQSGPQSQRPPRATINDLQCSPGGAFGDYVYVAVRTVDRNFDTIGGVERVTFTGASSLAPPGLVSNYYATNISFTPAGWRGGDLIEVTMKGDPSSTGGDSFVEPFDAAWAAQGTRGFRFGTDAATAVDPTGGFSSDLFFEASDGYDGSGSTFVPGGIYRIDSAGVESLFGPPRFDEMRFGRGGAWGSDLYVDGESFSPNGTSTPLGTVFLITNHTDNTVVANLLAVEVKSGTSWITQMRPHGPLQFSAPGSIPSPGSTNAFTPGLTTTELKPHQAAYSTIHFSGLQSPGPVPGSPIGCGMNYLASQPTGAVCRLSLAVQAKLRPRGRDRARHHVGGAARREWDQDGDRAGGKCVGLRECRGRCQQHAADGESERQIDAAPAGHDGFSR